jgi:hypothetical protein
VKNHEVTKVSGLGSEKFLSAEKFASKISLPEKSTRYESALRTGIPLAAALPN